MVRKGRTSIPTRLIKVPPHSTQNAPGSATSVARIRARERTICKPLENQNNTGVVSLPVQSIQGTGKPAIMSKGPVFTCLFGQAGWQAHAKADIISLRAL